MYAILHGPVKLAMFELFYPLNSCFSFTFQIKIAINW